jgi:hypothetical protein
MTISPKQRFMIMIVTNAVCVAMALAAIIAHANYHQAYGLPLFVVAILTGFCAQIWFIVGLARATRLEKRL